MGWTNPSRAPRLICVNWCYKARSWTISNCNKHALFDFLIPVYDLPCHFTRHNKVKLYNTIFPNTACFISRHSSQRTFISLSRYYIARSETTINYTKKIAVFIIMHIFWWGILDKIRRLQKMHTLWAFTFSYSDTTLKLKV